jgi:hypothetical protein
MSKQQGLASVPEKMREKHDAIVALIDGFSREHLNEEYRVLCGRMAGVLARKRPSPFTNGTPAAWAAGIVRAVGWVNFLDDKTQKPSIKFTEVDKAFGISPATGAAKSKAIRDLLKMYAFDPDWTLPSRMADNPMIWMIKVNGMILDARHVPREIQEDAYRKGIIPYIPADGPGDGSAGLGA